MMIQVQAN